ncbi:hypothetical protein BHYA_0253g00150 [Botrytis hyacinthi]|uniref:Uncharacterized protein n=1 Tax=Botrytis hyacinthi TaxID=278943 RepID=A0A4Z1GB84_9HELO|nr:hypothetical protein BHYA_0253g00150 [Botrytis hyacinthi]
MSQHGSYAGRDDRSIASHSRTTTSLSVPRLSSNGRSRSRSGSVRAPSVASNGTARTPSHRSGSIIRGGDRSESPGRHHPLRSNRGSVTRERTESVSSDGTARPSKPRGRDRDTDSQAFDTESYTSGRKSYTSGQYNGYTRSHDDDQRSHRDRSAREIERLSERTESLNLRDPNHDRVAKWNKEVERETGGDRWNGDPTTGLRSVNGEGSNAPSSLYKGSHSGRDRGRPQSDADSYSRSDTSRKSYIPPPPGSFASGFLPDDTRSQSHDLALQEYRDDHAPHKTRSHTSRDFALEEYRSAHAPSESRSQRPRNPPPSYGRGTYVDGHHNIGSVDLRQTHMHKTTINGPDMSFMGGPSKKELRRMEKMREHERDMAMIDRGMVPPVRKGFWD